MMRGIMGLQISYVYHHVYHHVYHQVYHHVYHHAYHRVYHDNRCEKSWVTSVSCTCIMCIIIIRHPT